MKKETIFKIITTPLILFATVVPFISKMNSTAFAVFFSTTSLWWYILIKKIKLPSFGYSFYIFVDSSILHNFVSAALSIEEPVFFLTSIAFLFITPILFIYWIYQKVKIK